MLYRSLFRRALTLHLTHHSFRSLASSAAAMSNPTPIRDLVLDRSIFNETLYKDIRDFWFSELPQGAASQNDASINKWYGRDMSEKQKEEHDEECRQKFGHALEAVGPEKVELPVFVSGEEDVRQADVLAAPWIEEVKTAQQERGEEEGSETLLSLVLLLDQITRNIYRSPSGLKKVFTHYDRMVHALIHTSLSLTPSPILHPSHRLRPVIRQWFLMPLMHSEHLPSHHIFDRLVHDAKAEGEREGVDDAVSHCEHALSFERMHMDPLEKFGRYPHRNEALGRESSKEEEEFLRGGETFGVKQGGDDDKRVKEKSEL